MSMTEDERAIRELVDTWMAASKAGDIPSVLGLMADDVVFMVPGQEPFGKAQFSTASESMRSDRIVRRSIMCCNWRTLPGQM